MNLEKFKWPVIIAAGLHGALLSLTPARPFVPVGPVDPPAALPPIPKDPIIQVDDREPSPNDQKAPAGSENPLPRTPDNPVHPPEKPEFVVEVDERNVPFDRRDLSRIDPRPPGDEKGGEREGPAPTFYRPGDLDRPPRARVQQAPDYPLTLKQQGVDGSVTVEFEVDTQGAVVRAEATGYTQREFVEPALRAVRSWRFEPGRRQGRAVPFRMAIPIQFAVERA